MCMYEPDCGVWLYCGFVWLYCIVVCECRRFSLYIICWLQTDKYNFIQDIGFGYQVNVKLTL